MSGAIRAISQNGLRARRCARGMLEDCRAIAATEFAVIELTPGVQDQIAELIKKAAG